MTFEELLKKPIDELSDEELQEVASKMRLDKLAALEKKIRRSVKKKPKAKKVEKAKNVLNDLIAKGLGNAD